MGIITTTDSPALAGGLRSPWARFLVRRGTRFAVSLWVLITFAFLIVHLVPGDPVRKALGVQASAELVQVTRDQMGLNDPLPVQYWNYLAGLARGDLGVSIQSRLPVDETVARLLPNTLMLAVLAFVVVMLVAIPLGTGLAVLTQLGRHRGTELSFTSVAIVLGVIPEFLLAVGLVYVFAVTAGWFPIADKGGPESFVLPVLALAIGPTAVIARIVRVETLSVLGSDYVRTARAKRLRPARSYLRHALPNALTATLTLAGLLLCGLVAGTVLVETIFAWPGLGPTLVGSILDNDYPMIQAIVLVYGTLVLLINLSVDVLLALVDPRSTIREA